MSEEIRKLYHKAWVSPPDGKGIHTKAFHECATNYMKKGLSKEEAYKRCMGGLGRDEAVKKSHWSSRKYEKYHSAKNAGPGE